jgi:UDP-N-acetylmuramate dehydrogenase
MNNMPEYWQEHMQTTGLTSMKIGGSTAYYARVTNEAQLQESLALAHEHNLPVRCIGGGSNLILPDGEFTGLLLHIAITSIERVEGTRYQKSIEQWEHQIPVQDRYAAQAGSQYLQLPVTELQEVKGDSVFIKMGAGVPWGQAVMWSLGENLAGLHWYARIPSHVGGAVVNNIHGERHFLSEVVVAVYVWDLQTRSERILTYNELHFGYDRSVFHETSNYIITYVVFALRAGEPDRIATYKAHYMDWTKEKTRIQPGGANCGSVFQNLPPETVPQGGTVAAAWYVDHAGCRGLTKGALQVYEGHANFIQNQGGATQADFIALLQEIRQRVFDKFQIWLLPEVECMNEQGRRLVWGQSAEPEWKHV